jgi:hypothetical protein
MHQTLQTPTNETTAYVNDNKHLPCFHLLLSHPYTFGLHRFSSLSSSPIFLLPNFKITAIVTSPKQSPVTSSMPRLSGPWIG